MNVVETLRLHPSLVQVLAGRGFGAPEQIDAFLDPSLDRLASPHQFADMEAAVRRLLLAVRTEQPIAIYADRDVDGLTGLAILARTLRSVGGTVVSGSPIKGRGVDREVLERLALSGAKVMVLVDCGTGEHAELEWLKAQGIDVIVADHHRITGERPPALAWIHPGMLEKTTEEAEVPAGCVMAFKLAQAIWLSFLGTDDPARMDYFFYSHLDLVCLGILADRMPLRGENRILVWHGLRRLADSRKVGIAALARFCRLTPRSGPLTVREVTWQIIPMLNAAGRLGRPELTAELLTTEDPDTAHNCIDQLLELNAQRREAQGKSLESFEKAVLEQCTVETDAVLIAMAEGLEPTVTGLAAGTLARKYGRPTFLFVNQGEECVGSGRGLPGVDLFAWVEAHKDCLIKYGGHQGAVGLTIKMDQFDTFRTRLLAGAQTALNGGEPGVGGPDRGDISIIIEAGLDLHEVNEAWWLDLSRLSPFGTGHPLPLFQVNGIDSITLTRRRKSKFPAKEVLLKNHTAELKAQIDRPHLTPRGQQAMEAITGGAFEGPWCVAGYPAAVRASEKEFNWTITDIWKGDSHA